jgi:glycine cleavage system H protein
LAADEVFGTVEAVKTVSDLFLPVAGTILSINPLLEKQPELVNSDPYGDGWMIKISVADTASVEGLMDSAAYAALVG